ncbi:PXA domain-containing protein [Aspergillus spinulosporus]
MTTDPSPSGLQPFSQLKAGPTTSSSKSNAVPAPTTTITPSQSSRRLQSKNDSRNEQINGANDRALAALVRRVLCPQMGIYGGATSPYAPEELLPPLTSSNDVDRQLYALVAMMVKEFISSWYSKITSDQALISEVLQLIAHLTRALEQRLREINIVQLALDDIPALVETHITSYRLATEQSNLSGLAPSPREIYHALNPHPGLSPVPDPSDANSVTRQRDSETIYRRLLVNGVLTVLLPTEDLENACLRTLLSDILSDLILGNQVSERVCEGWFVWESTTKLLDMLSRDKDGREGAALTESPGPNRLHQFGLLGNTDSDNDTTSSQSSGWMWLILQYAFYVYVTLRFIVAGLFRKASSSTLNPSLRPQDSSMGKSTTKYAITGKRPVLDYRLFGMLSQLLDLSRRMPWLGGLLALFQYLILAGPGKVGDTGGVLDRFLHENIEEYVLTPTLLPNLLQALREALFPHNIRPKSESSVNRVEALTSTSTSTPPTPGAQPFINTRQTTTASGGNAITPSDIATEESPRLSPDQQRRPSPAEVASIRRKCALGILNLVPRPIARRLFGVPTEPSSGDISAQVESPALSPSQFQAAGPGARSGYPSSSPSPVALGSDNRSDAEESLLASAIESNILDLFADEYCNKHLVYSIIETVLAKLMPELSDRSIAELMEDRAVLAPAV